VSISSVVSGSSLLLAAPIAVAAGLVSFLSPCVLPLVPGYLSYVTGLSGTELAARSVRRSRVLAGAVLFVLGFTAVFTVEGALFGTLGASLRSHERGLEQVFGVITVVLGLAFAGLLDRVPLASRTFRLQRSPGVGIAAAPALGLLFGLGWTPCAGPTLGAVVGLSATTGTAGRGAVLSVAYCLGLGIPFLLVALGARSALGAFEVVKRHSRAVMVVGGALLVAVGLLEVSGTWAHLVRDLQVNGGTSPL